MKTLMMMSSLSLFLAACDEGQVVEDDPTVEAPTNTDEATSNEEDSAGNLIIVEVEFDIDDDIYDVDEEGWDQRIEVPEGMSLLELMQEYYEIEEENGIITSIEGYAQDETSGVYWLFDINDQHSTVGAGEYVLQDGDEIDWTLDD